MLEILNELNMLLKNGLNIQTEDYWEWVRDMKLLNQPRDVMRKKHYSIGTDEHMLTG